MMSLQRKECDLVRRKLAIILFLCAFLTGCGGSAAPESATFPASADSAVAEPEGFPAEQTHAPESGVEVTAETAPEAVKDKFTASASPTEEGEYTEPVNVSSSNYFTFSRANSVTTADDGTELLYEYSCDTAFSSWNEGTQSWVDSILEQIHRDYSANSENLLLYAREHLAEIGTEYFYGFSNYQEVAVGRHDTHVVSLMVLSSVYSGGTHPNSVQTAWNLDLANQKLLSLEDVIHPEMAPTLAQMVRQQVDEKFLPLGEGALFDNYGDTIANSFAGEAMTPYWYFNDQGMVIFFNQYELGPYASGIIKTQISYPELAGILREEYFPGNDTAQIPGDMLLRGDWDGYRKIPITVESDGERILIGVEGEVYQVQLSEVSWLEGTAIGQRMLFSADRMNQNDVLELIGGYDDETRSFAVEFMDGQGNVTVYYVHPEGITPEP